MTIEERLQKIEKKNETLEKEVRTLREQKGGLRKLSFASIALALAGFVGGTVLSVQAYTAAIEPTNITTREITLKDQSNRTRMVLDGVRGRVLAYDENGKERARLASNGFVYVSDANGKPRATLNPGGNVYTYDANGKLRVRIESDGTVGVDDSNGLTRVRLNASDNKIYFLNASGQTVAAHP